MFAESEGANLSRTDVVVQHSKPDDFARAGKFPMAPEAKVLGKSRDGPVGLGGNRVQ